METVNSDMCQALRCNPHLLYLWNRLYPHNGPGRKETDYLQEMGSSGLSYLLVHTGIGNTGFGSSLV